MQKSKNDNNNEKKFGRPQSVWEDEFPVGSASVFRGRRKGDPDTRSGLGKIVIARAARRKKLTLLYAFLLRKSLCSKNWVSEIIKFPTYT